MKKMIAIVLALMLCVSALSVVAIAAEDTYTVHVKVPAGTATPKLWAWGDYGDAFSTWPGNEMTADGEWYVIDVPMGTNGLIVNTDGDTDKSANITVDGDKDVWVVCSLADGHFVADSISYDGGNTTEKPEEPAAPSTYYVAGSAGLCGSEWNVNDAANEMTKGSNGIWTKTYSNVPAGSYSLKVTSGDWNLPSWGGDGEFGNYDITVEEGAEVVVKFNPETQVVTVVINGENSNPGTGDMSLAAVSIALMAATAGLVVLGKKKEF